MSTALVDEGTSSAVRFEGATRNVTLLRNGATVASFTGAQGDPSAPEGIEYEMGSNSFGLGCIPRPLGISYILTTGYGVNFPDPAPGATDSSNLIQIGGAPTITPGELSSGTYSSVILLGVIVTGTTDGMDAVEGVPANIAFDLASGRLSGTLAGNGDGPPVTIRFTATLTPGTTRFEGVATTGTGATGKLRGGFFGPGGLEYGFAVAIDDGTAHYIGIGIGRR